MPELSINQDEILFLLQLIVLLGLVTYSVMARHLIDSVLLFSLACLTFSFIISRNNTMLAIVIGVLYTSMCATFVLLTKITYGKLTKKRNNKFIGILLGVIGISILSLSNNILKTPMSAEPLQFEYSMLSEIICILSILILISLIGIIFLMRSMPER
ncbi:MAG: hypothetical protein LBE97_01685 [Holosporales bacterium]|nr:hypothetical protein [Holosporales bacterium]